MKIEQFENSMTFGKAGANDLGTAQRGHLKKLFQATSRSLNLNNHRLSYWLTPGTFKLWKSSQQCLGFIDD
jgi:hypothetical protein